MASKSNQRRKGKGVEGGVITRLCSINSSGLVFYSDHRLGISAEVSLKIETHVFGKTQEWMLQGWVVECEELAASEGEVAPYQVTLLFSDMPKALRLSLALATHGDQKSYPVLDESGVFGMN